MLSKEEISERNGLLIDLIRELDLDLHIIGLPHSPKLTNIDYSIQYFGYCKNFHFLLMDGNSDIPYLDIRLKPIKNMDLEDLKPKILNWMGIFTHQEIHALKLANTKLYVSGFNHHNKILKTNPYPVFSEFDPILYYSFEKAAEISERFSSYQLIIT